MLSSRLDVSGECSIILLRLSEYSQPLLVIQVARLSIQNIVRSVRDELAISKQWKYGMIRRLLTMKSLQKYSLKFMILPKKMGRVRISENSISQ